MARVLTAPTEWEGDGPRALFVAGGISDCPNWQRMAIDNLADLDIVILNPRRPDFPILPEAADELAEEQIEWEYDHLAACQAILFWFPAETLCPIVLFELGRWTTSAKPLFVGTHPDYARRRDVVIQTKLARPDINVVSSVSELCEQVRAWA